MKRASMITLAAAAAASALLYRRYRQPKVGDLVEVSPDAPGSSPMLPLPVPQGTPLQGRIVAFKNDTILLLQPMIQGVLAPTTVSVAYGFLGHDLKNLTPHL